MNQLKSNPSFSELLRNPALFLAFGLGSGLSPKAPGTAGTLLGTLLFIPLLLWSQPFAIAVLVIGLLVGSWLCGVAADYMNVHDHGGIVWDEFVGVWLVLVLLPEQSMLYWVLAFFVFRIFDVVKPWPIKWADQKVSGGFGIMLDDVLAGLLAIAVIWITHVYLLS